MAESDYICVYRQFFEEFAKTFQMEDCRLMRVNLYNLSVDELVGEVMQSCVNYLVERKCPRSLVVPLTKIVVEELINEAKKEPGEVNTPLKLNKKTHDKISEVCLRYTDNEKLSNLPGPVQETYYSTHSTKHTRRRMEDRLICFPRFNTLHGIQNNSEAGYYGIFDGHSGVNAASYAVSHLHQFLAESEYYPDDPVQAFRQAFEKTENKYNMKDENSGTAVVAILHQPLEKKLTVAWVGDSQAMLVDKDSYVLLVDPHKPERTDERKRIEALGGCIIETHSIYRVNGGLAISRAIGDKNLKPYISAEPEIRVFNLTGSEHFIVMGCDGLWDVVEPQQVIETVYFEVKKNSGQIDLVAKKLVDLAKENNSTDNISVIVVFLTDPAEISNLSVDPTGHRPKNLIQDGVIMEANYQNNEKPLFKDSGMNGIYETNGNHFNDHIQNESDEDFGPETDVDAVDDILTSPKNLNPFGKDCWPKSMEENSENLIELPKNLGDEIIKFSEDFVESTKPVDDEDSNQVNCKKLESDGFQIENTNPFETSVKTSASEASDILNSFSEDSNKYIDEITSKKEVTDNFTPTNVINEVPSEFKSDAEQWEKKSDRDLFGFGNSDMADTRQNDICLSPKQNALFPKEEINSETEKNVQKSTEECTIEKPEFGSGFDTVPSNENNESLSNETSTTLSKTDEFRVVEFSTNEEEPVNLIAQDVPLDANGHPPTLCSVVDIVETQLTPPDTVSVCKEDEPTSELLSPSAPALDGEFKDETVAESVGEVEDSEDDEWNYIKVESGTHQVVPANSEQSDLVILSPNETQGSEKSTMNSPLNPEADEFIPVSALSTNNDFNLHTTPKKPIPDDLTDIIASSPNWNNMNNVSLPEETAFLNEIKSRPSNIFENNKPSPEKDFEEKNNDLLGLNLASHGGVDKENECVNPPQAELRGLDLASDMTSSFIDPTTMSSEIDMPKEQLEIENLIVEKKEMPLTEEISTVEDSILVESPSKMPDLLSPVPAQEVVPLLPESNDALKPNVTETSTTVIDPVTSEIIPSLVLESPNIPLNQESSLLSGDLPLSKFQTTPAALEASPIDEKSNETLQKEEEKDLAAGVAAVAATAVAATATQKNVKKPASKFPSTEVSKTSATAKPLSSVAKTSTVPKKPASTTGTAKVPISGKTPLSATKSASTTTKTLTASKQLTKTTTSVTTTLSKAPARPKPASNTSVAARVSPTSKTSVTSSPTKPATTPTTTLKSTSRTMGTITATLKPKPRAPSTTLEKKPAVNGETKTTLKRTEISTKKPGGISTTTATATRVSLSSRPTTAPAKSTNLKTTTTTSITRTVTAKPKTATSTTTASSPVSSVNKPLPTTRKTGGVDKQAKEVANRLTSKATPTPRTNGVSPRNTATTLTKTRKALSTATTPSNTKTITKTEIKAEKMVEEKIEITKSENGDPVIEKTTDINLINSITSE